MGCQHGNTMTTDTDKDPTHQSIKDYSLLLLTSDVLQMQYVKKDLLRDELCKTQHRYYGISCLWLSFFSIWWYEAIIYMVVKRICKLIGSIVFVHSHRGGNLVVITG